MNASEKRAVENAKNIIDFVLKYGYDQMMVMPDIKEGVLKSKAVQTRDALEKNSKALGRML